VNYSQAEAYLLDLELFGMRFGLDRMHKLMTVLGTPQRRFASIHVVGSNGKSSTVRMIAAVLERHGLRTGTYTSPHLRSFAERIEVGEEPIDEAAFAAAVTRVGHAASLVNKTADADDRVTQFEALTAAAYHELARREVSVAVVEAGLGGRWDATNVIPSKVQVLTSVGLEHTRWLGPTVADIASEKLAVVRDLSTLVVGPLPAEAEPVVERVVAERRARLVRVPPVQGGFPRQNFAVATAAAEAFLGSELDATAVEEAAVEVRVPGRLELVSADGPLVLHDGAHNPAGAAALAEALPGVVGGRRLVGVFGVLDDKDAASMLRELLPLCDAAVFTRSANPRSLSPATLAALAKQVGGPSEVECVGEPGAAVARASELAGPDGAVIATGSIYLIADLVRQPGAARVSRL
jgi:dihydrofolate synthase/folylpolyglutamate synthase